MQQPKSQLKLYGFNDLSHNFIKLYAEKKLPNKILLTGIKGLGKCTLAYHLINYVLSINEEYSYDNKKFEINSNNKSYKLIQNGSHPNFYLIDVLKEKKSIEVSQIRTMINYTNKSSFNDCPRFILIDNIELLTTNSLNALLKVIEEPNEKTHFILIHNNEEKILDTLKSRCITFKVAFSIDKSLYIANKLLDKNILELINNDLINYYCSPGDFINLFNFFVENNLDIKETNLEVFINKLINEGLYKKNTFIKSHINKFIELYFLKRLNSTNNKNKVLSIYSKFLNDVHDAKIFNLDQETLYMEFKSKML